MKSRMYAAAFVGVLAAAGAAYAIALNGGDNPHQRPNLDVSQSASAEHAGIRLTADRAAFSGTATWLSLVADIVDEDPSNPVVRVIVPASGISSESLPFAPASHDVSLAPDRETVLRLGPASPDRQPVVVFTVVELIRADGSREPVAGMWELSLGTPRDLARRLAVEHLSGQPVSDASITVSLESAVRSTTETLVTIRVDAADDVEHLAEPALVVAGEQLHGYLLDTQEDGNLLTFSFQRTAFGKSVEIRWGPFVTVGTEHNGSATIDLGAVIARNGLKGETFEEAPVLAADHLRTTGDAVEVRSIWFGWETGLDGFRTSILYFTVEGIIEGIPYELFAVTGPRGPVRIVAAGTGYNKDERGRIHSPRTDIGIPYNSLRDLNGEFTITVTGAAEELIRGDWTMNLSPRAEE